MKKWMALIMALLMAWAPLGVGEEEKWYAQYEWAYEWEEEELEAFIAQFSLEGDTLIVREGVTALGSYTGEWDEETDEPADRELAAKFEGSFSFESYFGPDFSYVQWPSTLRYIGDYAFNFYSFKKFTLPRTLELLGDFYGCTFDVLRIEADLPFDMISKSFSDHCTVGAYEAPEDHPLYKTVDGVLFSKDGKTLLSYPNGRQEAHYDVPAGVERIGSWAFDEAEALKTVSLPIGLKAVEDYAFSGCCYLQSIALPLTVKEIGDNIFNECVSLELVSLPEGMKANRWEDRYWAQYYPDDRIYRGDNGDTLTERGSGSYVAIGAPGVLRGGGQEITLYEKSYSDTAKGTAPDGKIVYLRSGEDGRALLADPFRESRYLGWADFVQAEYLPEETLFEYYKVYPNPKADTWRGSLPATNEELQAYAIHPDVYNEARSLFGAPSQEEEEDDEGIEYEFECFGPFVIIGDNWNWNGDADVYACRIQDVRLTRRPDGTENVYGVLFSAAPYDPIPLLEEQDGNVLAHLMGGTQVKILEEEKNGYRVTTGLDTGWVAGEHVMIIEAEEGEEE